MLLELKDVHIHYGTAEAVKGVSINVDREEFVSLIGANGAGKTTILRSVQSDSPPLGYVPHWLLRAIYHKASLLLE